MNDTTVGFDPLTTVTHYLAALQEGAAGEELAAFFTADAIQEEFPNRLNPTGGRSDLATILERAERGQTILSAQTFNLESAVVDGNRVALEVEWSATLAIPVSTLHAGETMRARFAIFIELKDGKIFRQRNYDCFEPW